MLFCSTSYKLALCLYTPSTIADLNDAALTHVNEWMYPCCKLKRLNTSTYVYINASISTRLVLVYKELASWKAFRHSEWRSLCNSACFYIATVINWVMDISLEWIDNMGRLSNKYFELFLVYCQPPHSGLSRKSKSRCTNNYSCLYDGLKWWCIQSNYAWATQTAVYTQRCWCLWGLSQGKSQEVLKYLFIHSHVDAFGGSPRVSPKKSSNTDLFRLVEVVHVSSCRVANHSCVPN